jgi:histone H3/H4
MTNIPENGLPPSAPLNTTHSTKTTRIVTATQVKEFLKAKGFNCANDLVESLATKVEAMLEVATLRAESNGRKTVRGYDL